MPWGCESKVTTGFLAFVPAMAAASNEDFALAEKAYPLRSEGRRSPFFEVTLPL
jgi:hypothetical protein